MKLYLCKFHFLDLLLLYKEIV